MFEKYQEQTSLKKTRIKKVYGIFVKCFHMITKLKSQELWSQMMSYSYFSVLIADSVTKLERQRLELISPEIHLVSWLIFGLP